MRIERVIGESLLICGWNWPVVTLSLMRWRWAASGPYCYRARIGPWKVSLLRRSCVHEADW